ncbi:hypothetical protein JOQ06_004673 [Pogonophryne albipinna]|uniref:Uncharacterized protein n=1 Tax=Pogonophryne albipinna TaxID=1090488 RepID=A0AAD6FCV1_9TELE|nr:hypothetical protein JOQ06_004673 [Pogonophryne albipinna]
MLMTSSIRCLQSEASTGIAVGSEQVLRLYDRECLLSLQRRAAPEPGLLDYVPEELLKRPRKRGRRGGIKHRLHRRCNKPPLPSILFSNVRSLRNKTFVSVEKVLSHVAEDAPKVTPCFSAVSTVGIAARGLEKRCRMEVGVHTSPVERAISDCKKFRATANSDSTKVVFVSSSSGVTFYTSKK